MTVYVAGCKGSRLVKIGWTSGSPARRLVELQCGSPYPLHLLWKSAASCGMEIEETLHKLFHPYREHGEWFDFGDADPVALVAAAINLPSLQTVAPPLKLRRRMVVRPKARTARKAPARISVDRLLEDLDAVLGDLPMPVAKVASLLLNHDPDSATYRRITGKALRAELALLGIKVPKTGNRHPVNPAVIRAMLTARSTSSQESASDVA